jgi:parallel beta-helix repeat protein
MAVALIVAGALAPVVSARTVTPLGVAVGTVVPVTAVAEQPPGTLQALIDDAADGATVVVPPGIYREWLTIHRPLTLSGTGAEIRGSDRWVDWSAAGDAWRSDERVPDLGDDGRCIAERCQWPEQVFVDGQPQLQVGASPQAGQFALDDERRVLLGSDPTGHEVEVTVRPYWIEVDGPDVTIEGFTMRHAASPAQFGALQSRAGADRLLVRRVHLSDAHAALISFQDVAGASLLDSTLERGGQLGIQSGGDGTTNLTISGNHVLDNNTEGFDPEWEAGGMKIAIAHGLRVTDNDVDGNLGPGIWCDLDCRDADISDNRVTDNDRNGILFETSQGGRIVGNSVAENGWGHSSWGWGAGILVSSSSDVTVEDNDLAWNADGIVLVSQDRLDEPGGDRVHDTTVRSNAIALDAAGGYLLAWLEDWDGGIYAADAANVGVDNHFWHDRPEPSTCRFEWAGCKSTIAAFAATPGGTDSRYLSQAERDDVLAVDELPTVAKPTHQPEPPRARDVAIVLVVVGSAGLVIVIAAVVIARRRRRPASA